MPRTVACSRKAGSSEANTFSACLSSAHDCPPFVPIAVASVADVLRLLTHSLTHCPLTFEQEVTTIGSPPLHIEVVNRWNSVFYRFEPSIHPTWLLLFGCTSFLDRVNIRLWKCQTCESNGQHDRLQVVTLLLPGSTFDFVSSDTFINYKNWWEHFNDYNSFKAAQFVWQVRYVYFLFCFCVNSLPDKSID